MNRRLMGALLLIGSVLGIGLTLALWKRSSLEAADAGFAAQPEPMEAVAVATARPFAHRRTITSVGTVVALRSISLRNELSGTVRQVGLVPGSIVEKGRVLIGLDVSVEEAELRALEAQASLAESLLGRTERASAGGAVSDSELDRARAERDIARAQIARTRAIIERKTLRAPFRARVGMADVHPGQYLEEGTLLTTLQGVDDSAHVDFAVAQQVAAGLEVGDAVDVFPAEAAAPIRAAIVAIDARVDPATRNAVVRARIADPDGPSPGASVRVRVPVGPIEEAIAVPVQALRKGPEGDHVFVITPDERGQTRAHVRPVEGGPVVGGEILVLEGLQAGEQVAASGSFKLRESVLVAIATPAAPAGAVGPAAPAVSDPPDAAAARAAR